jgi:hypothetical protein
VAVEGLTSALSAISLSYNDSLPIKTERGAARPMLERSGGDSGGGVCKTESTIDTASPLIESKLDEGGQRASSHERFGLTYVRPDRKAWSVANTNAVVEHKSPHLPTLEEWVGITGGTGTKMHHVKCHYLYCKHGILANIAYHGGVRVSSMNAALTAGYTQGECCRRMWTRP